MTSTWVDAGDVKGNVTRGRPGDIVSERIKLITLWGLAIFNLRRGIVNETRRLRTWDHFPVVVKIDGKESKGKKGKKGLAGWIPKTENDGQKFQEQVLCPAASREWMHDDGEGGLEALQARLEGAAAEVKATTTTTRNKNKFEVQVQDSGRDHGDGGGAVQESLTPEGSPPIKQDCAETCTDNGFALRKNYDEKIETLEVQAERVRYQRCTDYNRPGLACTGEVQCIGRLIGGRDAAMFTNGNCVRGHTGSRSGSKVSAALQRHGEFYVWYC